MKATLKNQITHEVERDVEFREAVVKAIELGVKENKPLYYNIYTRNNEVCCDMDTDDGMIASVRVTINSFEEEDNCTRFFINYLRAHANDYLEETEDEDAE